MRHHQPQAARRCLAIGRGENSDFDAHPEYRALLVVEPQCTILASRDVADASRSLIDHKFSHCGDATRHDLPRAMSSEVEEESIDLFQEPADFYEPEKQASFASHQLLSGQKLTVRLVGHNPLWVSNL